MNNAEKWIAYLVIFVIALQDYNLEFEHYTYFAQTSE